MGLKAHTFSVELTPSEARVHVVALSFSGNAVQIWIVDDDAQVQDLAVAFPAAPEAPSKILGPIGGVDGISETIASRLSKKLKKPVFVGFNSTAADPTALNQIQKGLNDEIKQHPELF